MSGERADDADDADDALLRALARAPEVSVSKVRLGGDVVELAEAPAAIAGFTIVRTIGAGGMGVVYEALDPTLERRVAIKVLRRHGDRAAERMLREARALAKLSHPNIVTVHEAGIVDDRVYLVMELVAGVDARRWLAAKPRTIDAIVDIYRQGALGLAAAHAGGLVHRDVKPDNLLVGDDGRVRVTDFGLVGTIGAANDPPSTTVEAGAPADLTVTGTILGTLPYIAPEAHRGGELGPAADQFALCVALWEAIAGERPHVATSSEAALIDAVCAGRLASPVALPPAIRVVLARGLASDPAARWPSFPALFDALARARRRRRGRRAAAVVAGIATVGTLAFAASRSHEHAPPPPRAIAIATPAQACPYMPVFADDATLAFTDEGGLYAMPAAGGDVRSIAGVAGAYRANRGRRAGEVVLTAGPPTHGAFVDVHTGAQTAEPIDSASFAYAGGALFYSRLDVPEIRRVFAGADRPVAKLPDGRWGYTIATSPDGLRLAITTAADRSSPTICTVDLDPATRLAIADGVHCLDRADISVGRAALSRDALYYQTQRGIRRRTLALDELWLPGANAEGGLDVSPDGKTLLYSDAHATTFIGEPGQPAVLSGPIGGAVTRHGGGWLYVRTGDESDELIARERDGRERLVAANLGRLSAPMVDRTGVRAVFDADAGAASGLYVLDLTPFPPVRLTTTAGDSNPIWTADGRVAFTRWDAHDQPGVVIVDPADGIRGDATRTPRHPLPRVTAGTLWSTGELVLLALDGKALYAWDPTADRERALDLAPLGGRVLWQAMPADDGQTIAVLASDWTVWTIALDGKPARQIAAKAPCTTGGPAVFDDAGRLFLVTRPSRGSIRRVDL